ncbi:hypothetical protein KAR91_52175 [Candidatus Pacearchaeota archaeon]|nr:hypothetical protein [Candidatus Pacearchaeota archaeon]
MEKLNKDVLEAIKKNLSETTAGALREFINDNKETVKELKAAKEKIKKLELAGEAADENIIELLVFKNMKDDLDKREESLNSFDKQLKERDVTTRINESVLIERENMINERIGDYQFMFTTVFRNTSIKKDILKNRPIKNQELTSGYTDNNGNPIMQDGGELLVSDNEIETTTEK